ncbi:MAG: PD-(D/E)XK nuclease family protein [Eubacteriales bacterium]
MVHFLFGNSGTGKSSFIVEKIREDAENGKRSFLIVPEQQTVVSERILASSLPAGAQLITEVVNFTRLSNEVFRKVGGLKYNYITKSGKNLVMYRAICECRDFLSEYKVQKGKEKGCVSVFLDAIGELKSYGVSISELEKASEEIENDRLKRRLNDIVLIYSAYERILNERYSDPYDDILMLAKKLEDFDFFGGSNVYVDSFYGFTKSQLDVLYHVIDQSDNFTVSLDCPEKDGGIQYAKIYETSKSIEKICKSLGKKITRTSFTEDRKHNSPALRYLCENIWSFSAQKIENDGSVRVIEADDEFDECDCVASSIRQLVEGGAKYSDIAVIARNSDTYRGIIDVSLKKYDVSYYFSSRTDIAAKPVVKMIFSALAAINGYRAEDIVSYLKCGYTDIDESDIDDLESYIYRWNIYGSKFKNDDFWSSNPDGYVTAPTISQLETLARVNGARDKVIEKLSILERAFSPYCSVEAGARAVFEFLCAHNVKEKLSEEIKVSTKEEAQENSQVWNALISSLDTVVSVMKGAHVSAETFSVLLRYDFDGKNIGTIPTGEDVVTVGDASLLRTDRIKHAFIIGANEGVFPASVSDDGFFSDSDKVALESAGIVLSSKNDIRSSDELLYFQNSISSPSDSLTVSYVNADVTGGKKQRSVGVERIMDIFENFEPTPSYSIPASERIYTKETAKEYLSATSGDVKRGIILSLGDDYRTCDGFSNDSVSIPSEKAGEIFGNHLYLTQSRIETFVNCRFNYYCSYQLKLKSSSRISFSSNNIGDLTHKVFERFLIRIKEGKIDFSKITDDEIEKITDEITDEYIATLFGSGFQTNRLKHLFARLRSRLLIYLRNMVDEFAQCDFTPEFFELSFSSGGADTPVPLKFKINEKSVLTVAGIADRIDLYKKDGVTYVRVVDYKTGDKKFSLADAELGLGLQMLIYLFTMCKMDDCEFKQKLMEGTSEIRPAGVLYFPMRIDKVKLESEAGISSAENADEYEKNAVSKYVERNGIFLDDVEILKAQDKELGGKFLPKYPSRSKNTFVDAERFEEIYSSLEKTLDEIGAAVLSGDASASPLEHNGKIPCRYCENLAVCRRRKAK